MSEPAGSEDAAAQFWAFSLAFYATPGVAPACLDLQDRLGLDVNMLLLCCWLGTRRRLLSPREIENAERAVAPWREAIVAKLREVRRALKSRPQPAAAALRGGLASLELDAEREAQRLLVESLAPPPPSADRALAAARSNLAHYLEMIGVPAMEAEALLGALAGFIQSTQP